MLINYKLGGDKMAKITTGDLYNEWQLINDKLLTQIDKQDEIITKQQAIIDRFDNPIDTRLTGSKVEYVRKSTDVKPEGKANDSLFLWDTRQLLLHDGTDWREV